MIKILEIILHHKKLNLNYLYNLPPNANNQLNRMGIIPRKYILEVKKTSKNNKVLEKKKEKVVH